MCVSERTYTPVLAGLFTHDGAGVSLLAGECEDCGALSFPAAPICPQCQSNAIRSRQLSRSGTVYSFTIVRARPPEYRGPVPYALGFIDLPDGLRVYGPIVATVENLERLVIGASVLTAVLQLDETPARVTYCFEPIEELTDV